MGFVYCVVVVKATGDTYFRLNSTVLKCSAALKFSFESVHAYCRSPSACHPLKLGACCRIKILMGIIICRGTKGQCAPDRFNPLKPELNSICYLLALLGAHHFLHFSRIRVKLLTFRLLLSYIYGAPILDVSRSHTTTQHSREDSSGRVISSSQRPLPDSTRHSQQTNIHAPGGIRTQDLSR